MSPSMFLSVPQRSFPVKMPCFLFNGFSRRSTTFRLLIHILVSISSRPSKHRWLRFQR